MRLRVEMALGRLNTRCLILGRTMASSLFLRLSLFLSAGSVGACNDQQALPPTKHAAHLANAPIRSSSAANDPSALEPSHTLRFLRPDPRSKVHAPCSRCTWRSIITGSGTGAHALSLPIWPSALSPDVCFERKRCTHASCSWDSRTGRLDGPDPLAPLHFPAWLLLIHTLHFPVRARPHPTVSLAWSCPVLKQTFQLLVY